jgi:hypothetical protein
MLLPGYSSTLACKSGTWIVRRRAPRVPRPFPVSEESRRQEYQRHFDALQRSLGLSATASRAWASRVRAERRASARRRQTR